MRDALGDPIKLDDEQPARQGHTLKLTIDDRIQEETENVLAAVGEKFQPAKGATAIVMNPHDGELLAVANWPRVDANEPGEAPAWARQNRAVQTSYEPGSTFKAFTMAGALEDGKVTPDTVFQLPSALQVADRTITEAHGEGYGTLTASDIIKKSSNIGAVMIGQRLGATRFDQWVRRFGFGKTTGVDLPGEQTGIVLPRKKYSDSSIGNLPIGQGEAVTPMQMATAYAAIANGGILRPPRIVKAVGGEQHPAAARKAHHLHARLPAAADDARGRPRPGRHRLRRRHPALQPGRQDGHGGEAGPDLRRLLQDEVRGVLRGLRAGAEPAPADAGHGRRAGRRHLRRLGGRAGVA